MQGRLSAPVGSRIQAFPSQNWRDEFEVAQDCGLTLIEWIVEADQCERNPLFALPGEVAEISQRTGVGLISVCADYFMDLPLIRCQPSERTVRIAMLERLLRRAGELGVRYITIPFVDASAIVTDEELDQVADVLGKCLPLAQACGVQLALETSLDPTRFLRLLKRMSHPYAKVNYDIGNSASLGYDTVQEIETYGPWIASVHVKDRQLGGGTVPLGQGNADFDATFAALARIDYHGPLILQAARIGNEVEAARRYVNFVMQHLDRHFQSVSHGSRTRK